MISLLCRFKTKKPAEIPKTTTDVLPDCIRPSENQMKVWLKQGYVRHSLVGEDLICYQWVNWALEYFNKNVRVSVQSPPLIDYLQILYEASVDYLKRNEQVE